MRTLALMLQLKYDGKTLKGLHNQSIKNLVETQQSFPYWAPGAFIIFNSIQTASAFVKSMWAANPLTEHIREAKCLHDGCIVFRYIHFHLPHCDKAILFVPLSVGRVTASEHLFASISLPPHLSVCAARVPHITHFDRPWRKSLREALASYWDLYC